MSPSYHLEPRYFRDIGLDPDPGVVDLAARCQGSLGGFSRAARLIEYGFNSVALSASAMGRPPQIVHQQQCVLLEKGWKAEKNFLRWCRSRGARVVHTVHNLLPHDEKPHHFEIYSELYQFADALICHDAEAACEVNERFGVERERIFVVPHGPLFATPPSISQAECRAALGLDPERQMFLALGVLSPYKGLDLLLGAWSDLVRNDRHTSKPLLVIAGNGPSEQKRALEQLASELSLSGDTLRLDLHYIDASTLPLYLKAADVLLYPYREITTSGALLTGLNYCKPIIASDLPGFRDYLRAGRNALVTPAGDRLALTQALCDLRDQDHWAELAANSQANPELQVQWAEIGLRTADVYGAILRGSTQLAN